MGSFLRIPDPLCNETPVKLKLHALPNARNQFQMGQAGWGRDGGKVTGVGFFLSLLHVCATLWLMTDLGVLHGDMIILLGSA